LTFPGRCVTLPTTYFASASFDMKESPPPSSYEETTALIQACLDGNQRAWKTLIQRYGRLVYSIALRRGFLAADADEIFQRVFAIVFRRLPDLQEQIAFAGWLITITERECWRYSRRNRANEALDETLEDPDALPADRVQLLERQQQVREAIGKLGSPCRELLTALFLESPTPSYEQVAKRLGISVGSIGPTRSRCFKKLETILLEMGFDF
jgi:RNA polymerase sigma factor (sigma-70 family)